MSEWRSACVIAPYPPELLPNTPRCPGPPHPKRCSVAGSISCSRKSSQAPMEAELIHQQGQSSSVMPCGDIHIDRAHRWITQHIALEGLALDRDSTDRTDR